MKRSMLGLVCGVALVVASSQVLGSAKSGLRAGCYSRPSYNACLNCCISGGHGQECEQACWTTYRRFRTPGNPVYPA